MNNYLFDFREHGMFRSILDHWLVQLQVKHLLFEVRMQDTIGPDQMLQLMIAIDLFSLYVLFSHFRPRDGKFRPMREHPRVSGVYVCRFNLTVYILNISSWAIFILVSSLNIVNLILSISFPWPTS